MPTASNEVGTPRADLIRFPASILCGLHTRRAEIGWHCRTYLSMIGQRDQSRLRWPRTAEVNATCLAGFDGIDLFSMARKVQENDSRAHDDSEPNTPVHSR